MMDTGIEQALAEAHARLRAACERAGRSPDAVQLVAVTKTVPAERVREAAACGQTLFGENRVQEALAKMPECPGSLAWHLIGHLQRNKAAAAVRAFDMIHSVDSLRLLETAEAAAEAEGKDLPILLEINVSGERSKFGMPPEEASAVLRRAEALRWVRVTGLMTLPPFTEDPEGARPFFRSLRELRDRLRGETGFELPELSMGMSHDFEVAIEEGATFVRVGSAIFGRREG